MCTDFSVSSWCICIMTLPLRCLTIAAVHACQYYLPLLILRDAASAGRKSAEIKAIFRHRFPLYSAAETGAAR
jgi:hypothetical protein